MHCSHVLSTIPTTSETHRGKINRHIPRVFGIPRIHQEFREYFHTVPGKLTDRSAIFGLFMILTSDYGTIGPETLRSQNEFYIPSKALANGVRTRTLSCGLRILIRIYKQRNDPVGRVRHGINLWSDCHSNPSRKARKHVSFTPGLVS